VASCERVEAGLSDLDVAKFDEAAADASKAAAESSSYTTFSNAISDARAAAQQTDPNLLTTADSNELVKVCGIHLVSLASNLAAARQSAQAAAQEQVQAAQRAADQQAQARQAQIAASTPTGTLQLTSHRLTQICLSAQFGGHCFGDTFLCASFHIENTGQVPIGGLFGIEGSDFGAIDPDGQVVTGNPPATVGGSADINTPFGAVGVQIVPGVGMSSRNGPTVMA
jgi:hypothetical protein